MLGQPFMRRLKAMAGKGVLRADKGIFRPCDENRFVFACCKEFFEPAVVRRIASCREFSHLHGRGRE